MRDFTREITLRQAEHDAIAKDIDAYVQRGGVIQHLRPGATGENEGLYGNLAQRKRKLRQQRLAALDNDNDTEDTE